MKNTALAPQPALPGLKGCLDAIPPSTIPCGRPVSPPPQRLCEALRGSGAASSHVPRLINCTDVKRKSPGTIAEMTGDGAAIDRARYRSGEIREGINPPPLRSLLPPPPVPTALL